MKKSHLYRFVFLLLIVVFVFSCRNIEEKIKVEDAKKVEIKRYEEALFQADTENLKQELKMLDEDYHIFIQGNYSNSTEVKLLRAYLTDTNMIQIFKDVQESFPDLKETENMLSHAFARLNHFFPAFRPPTVYTYISGVNYEQAVSYLDSVLLIGIDNYLGNDYVYYDLYRIPVYRKSRMASPYIAPDCIKAIAATMIDIREYDNNLLERMIYEGKVLYIMEQMLKETEDQYIIGYTAEQIQWCTDFESEIWSFFINNEVLYKSEITIINKFILDGPFTSAISKDAPGRLGAWTGWQIVRRFMEKNPKTSLTDLLQMTDAQEILKQSKYKP